MKDKSKTSNELLDEIRSALEALLDDSSVAFYMGALTVDTTVGGVRIPMAGIFTADHDQFANKIFLTLETAQIRWGVTPGIPPTATTGHILEFGQTMTLRGKDIRNFRAIRTGASSGVLTITSWCRPKES